MAPRKHKRLSCKREKNACYIVLILLVLLSILIFGLSFLPKLQGTNTRVHLWVLSCSIFIITTTVILFLLAFCASCRCRGFRRPRDVESVAEDGNDKLDDGSSKTASPSSCTSYSSSYRERILWLKLLPWAAMTPHDVSKLPQFNSRLPSHRRPSLDIAPADGSENGSGLSPIDEESDLEEEEETGMHPSFNVYSWVELNVSAEYQPIERVRSCAAPRLDSLDFPASPYSEPTYPRPAIMPIHGARTEEEQLWEFERNWKPWDGKTVHIDEENELASA
jgi:hypothetical protein